MNNTPEYLLNKLLKEGLNYEEPYPFLYQYKLLSKYLPTIPKETKINTLLDILDPKFRRLVILRHKINSLTTLKKLVIAIEETTNVAKMLNQLPRHTYANEHINSDSMWY